MLSAVEVPRLGLELRYGAANCSETTPRAARVGSIRGDGSPPMNRFEGLAELAFAPICGL